MSQVRKHYPCYCLTDEFCGEPKHCICGSPLPCPDCDHDWQPLPRENSLVDHDEVCVDCGAERDR